MIGNQYKTLVVTGENPERSKSGNRRWDCKCILCEETVTHQAGNLKNGSFRCKCQYLPDGESAFRELYRDYVHGSKKRGYQFELDRDTTFRNLVNGNCHYCGCEPGQVTTRKGDSFKYNGIDRQNNKLGYIRSNVVTCCDTCNKAKHVMSELEFLDWVKSVYSHSCRDL